MNFWTDCDTFSQADNFCLETVCALNLKRLLCHGTHLVIYAAVFVEV